MLGDGETAAVLRLFPGCTCTTAGISLGNRVTSLRQRSYLKCQFSVFIHASAFSILKVKKTVTLLMIEFIWALLHIFWTAAHLTLWDGIGRVYLHFQSRWWLLKMTSLFRQTDGRWGFLGLHLLTFIILSDASHISIFTVCIICTFITCACNTHKTQCRFIFRSLSLSPCLHSYNIASMSPSHF